MFRTTSVAAGERAARAPPRQEEPAAGRAMLIGITALPPSRGMKPACLEAKHQHISTQPSPSTGQARSAAQRLVQGPARGQPRSSPHRNPPGPGAHTSVHPWPSELQAADTESCSSMLAPGSPRGGTQPAPPPCCQVLTPSLHHPGGENRFPADTQRGATRDGDGRLQQTAREFPLRPGALSVWEH